MCRLFTKNIIAFFLAKCNQRFDCIDGSDEANCTCEDGKQCDCYTKNPVTCKTQTFRNFIGCYSTNQSKIEECGPDITLNRTVQCGNCSVTISRFANISECQLLNDLQLCDSTTCYQTDSKECFQENCTSTEVICTSECSDSSCTTGFQCHDRSLALNSQFCDGKFDCPDRSDEIRYKPGFKCIESRGTCVLPQLNLNDTKPHCTDKSDLCLNDESCFHCIGDQIIVSSKQLCNGIFDCDDASDECLCENQNSNIKQKCKQMFQDSDGVCSYSNVTDISKEVLNSYPATIKCQTKLADQIDAALCDGNPECNDLRDECGKKCRDKPKFCGDVCHTFFTIGKYYCDGKENDIYENIYSCGCSKGFDESFCPKRHACSAGDKVSIRLDQICNGVFDCDDHSDEINCPKKVEAAFSSDTEMIKYNSLKSCFWIMGLAVIVGNMYVIISTVHYIRKTKNLSTSLKFQHLNILNISIADFIMGLYLITIAILSTFVYSGNYGQQDRKWRTSKYCSFLGSLAVLSSEASCFLMVLLTFYRLHNVHKPFSTLSSPSFIWKVGLVLAWLAGMALAFVPIIEVTGSYFGENIFFSNRFTTTTIGKKTFITNFACRLATLSGITIADQGENWQSVIAFLDNNFLEYQAFEEGYYGATSVCMPRFFVTRFESAMEYTLIIISINFVCFIFIAISYIAIYILSSKRLKIKARNNQIAKQEATMQRRIARIIFTDFLCWIPICIMVYLKINGVTIDNVVYVVSAGILLPINSAFNPLLYSSLVDKLVACCSKNYQKKVQNVPMKKVK